MISRILFRPEAEAELTEAFEWYEARSRGLGAEYLRALDGVIANIARQPLAYPILEGNVRRAVMRRFPFSGIYVPANDHIFVVACFHGRRDPKRWQERI